MLFQDQEKMCAIMDSELCLESEVDLPKRHSFKFVSGLACYHSAHVMHMTKVLNFIILVLPLILLASNVKAA